VYIDHVYNVRLHSFYYLKWRHLLNRLPLDNATLKLQHHGVGRRLAYRKDKRCVSGMRGQGQQSVLVMRRFLAKDCCIHAVIIITSWHCGKMTARYVRLTPPEAINAKMPFIEPNMTLWPTNNPYLNPVDYAVCGALQKMVYHCRSFKSVQELKRAIVAAWQTGNNSHRRSLAKRRRSISEWRRRLENVYCVMVDTSNMSVKAF